MIKHLKPIILTLNIVMAVAIASLVVGMYFINIPVILPSIFLMSLAVANTAYNFLTKAKTKWFSLTITFAILLMIFARHCLVSKYNLGIILLMIGQASLMGSAIVKNKFRISDLFYLLAIALPVLLTIFISPIFHLETIKDTCIFALILFLASIIFAKALADFIVKQNGSNFIFLFATITNLIFNFITLSIKYFNVTFKLDYFILPLFYFTGLLLLIVALIPCKRRIIQENILRKTKFKSTHLKYASSLLLTFFVCCYALTFTLSSFAVISPKISKEGFYKAMGEELTIPVVEISTQDNALPVNKEDYVNCSFEISNCDNAEQNFAVEMANNYGDANCVGIRLRGNSTKKAKKRPYRIKFDKKQSLMGLKKNKNWVLLADYYDQSYIRNYTAFSLANSIDESNEVFSPTGFHVALIINNEFKGLYLLCEQMDEKEGRANVEADFDVNVDKEFPFFLEMDYFAHKEGKTGVDNFAVQSANNHVEIKYPEADERFATGESDVVYNYIYEYVNAVFETLKTGQKVEVSFRDQPVGFSDLVEINSAVDYYLMNEIMLNYDSTAKSIYLSKTKDGKMTFGPIWDFDLSMTTEYNLPYKQSYIESAQQLYIGQNSVIFSKLLQDESFYNLVASRYNVIKPKIAEVCESLKYYKERIDKIALMDAKMWRGKKGIFEYDMQYDYVRLYLLDRQEFLSTVFANNHTQFIETYL